MWPKFFPDGVPPTTAEPAGGTAFRLVRSCPPNATDFAATYEEDPTRHAQPWEVLYATSFWLTFAECAKRRARYLPLRQRRIVVGTLAPSMGRQFKTRKHLSVWLVESSDVHVAFVTDAEQV